MLHTSLVSVAACLRAVRHVLREVATRSTLCIVCGMYVASGRCVSACCTLHVASWDSDASQVDYPHPAIQIDPILRKRLAELIQKCEEGVFKRRESQATLQLTRSSSMSGRRESDMSGRRESISAGSGQRQNRHKPAPVSASSSDLGLGVLVEEGE